MPCRSYKVDDEIVWWQREPVMAEEVTGYAIEAGDVYLRKMI